MQATFTELEITQRVQQICFEQLGCSKDQALNSNFVDDLGADSLDLIELVMAIEDEFNIEIDDEIAEGLQNGLQVIEYLRGRDDLS